MNISESDILSIATRGVYYRTLSRTEYKRAFGIARKHFLNCGKSFPIGDKKCPLLSMRYWRSKTNWEARQYYKFARAKLFRSVNLP